MTNTNSAPIWPDPESVSWTPSLLDTVMYAAATWEYQRLHFDPGWAAKEGLDWPIVHGPLLGTKLTQLVDHWARDQGGTLVKIQWRNLSAVVVDSEVELSGSINERSKDDDPTLVTVSLSISSSEGEHVRGSAVVRRSA